MPGSPDEPVWVPCGGDVRGGRYNVREVRPSTVFAALWGPDWRDRVLAVPPVEGSTPYPDLQGTVRLGDVIDALNDEGR